MSTKNRTMILGIAKFAMFMLSTNVFAHGDQQHVMGTVTEIDANSISIKTVDGVVKVVAILPATRFVRGNSPAAQQELKIGDRVVIHAKPEGGALNATEVKIGISTKAATGTH